MRSVSYFNFYRSVQNKLQQVFLGCKVVSKGINNHCTGDSGGAAATILQYVDIAGSSLLLPPANFNLGNTVTATAPSSSSPSLSLTVSMRDLDTVTETVGRRLTLMFGEQLNFVSGEFAWLLGECASREIVAHLWTKGIINAAAAPPSPSQSQSQVSLRFVSTPRSTMKLMTIFSFFFLLPFSNFVGCAKVGD